MSLSDLIERLEGAEGPDRELDQAIMATFYVWDRRYIGCRCDPSCCPNGAHLDSVWVEPATDKWVTTAIDGFEFTSSIDRARALASFALPSLWCVAVMDFPSTGSAMAQLHFMGGGGTDRVTAPTPALALCLAICRAKEASDA